MASRISSSTMESKKSPSGSTPRTEVQTGLTGPAAGPVLSTFSSTISSWRCRRSLLRRKTFRQMVKSQLLALVPSVYWSQAR